MVDGETSIVRFGHHRRAYLEGLTKFWSFWGSSAPSYSPFCTLKMHTFDPIPLENPTCHQVNLDFIRSSSGVSGLYQDVCGSVTYSPVSERVSLHSNMPNKM